MKVSMFAGITVIIAFLFIGMNSGGASIYLFIDLTSILIVLGLLIGGILFSIGIAVPIKAIKNALMGDGVPEIDELKQYVNFFNLASQLSIAGGITGMFIGLISMLATMDNPSTIGHSMAVTLITVLYGVFLSEFVFQPLKHALLSKSAAKCLDTADTDSGQSKSNRWLVLGLGVFSGVFSFLILLISFT